MHITKALLLGVSLSLAQATAGQLTDHTPSSINDQRQPTVEAAATITPKDSERKNADDAQLVNPSIYEKGTALVAEGPANRKAAGREAAEPINARIYGMEPAVPRDSALNADGTLAGYVPPKRVPASDILKGSVTVAEGAANLRAANREEASVGASVGAGMSRLAGTFGAPKKQDFEQAPHFNSAKFMREVVDFQLNLSDEKFMLEAQSEQEARYRLDVLRQQHRTSEVWQQNSQQINSLIGFGVAVALVLWWWRSSSPRTTVWIVRVTVLAGSFYLHWVFGLFMLLGLYTHTTRGLNGR